MTIILCLPGDNFSGKFLQSFASTLAFFHKKGWDYGVSIRSSSNVNYVRSMCLGADVLRGKNQKPFAGQHKYDYILWIDSDIVWKNEDIENLLNTEGDIVSGLYLMSDQKRYTAVENMDYNFFKQTGYFYFLDKEDIQQEKYQKPFNVDYIGMGFMAVKYGVFESINYPWFQPEVFDLGDNIMDFSSEDVAFCMKAKRQGYNITVNPKIIVGHEKKIVI